ncbi:MAG: NAD-dependent succinate-semialdehyde dehydrogenase [Gammaproteobacteria bacterium]|nr:NAD-dependent succinate-semialdehyde dehydrogenase [Gammaproteobacteria bacterium]
MHGIRHASLLKEACLINGEWVGAENQKKIPVHNPFDGQILGHVPDCGVTETKRAIEAASTAWSSWRALPALKRCELLWAWSRLIDHHQEDLARIMTLEQGKPLSESINEMIYANGFIKWFAEEGRRNDGDVIPSNKRDQHLVVIKQPIGVVAAITPWNFPAAMITRKIAPALAVGCPVVVKPDSSTPFTALALASLAMEAGFPKGVLNMITGDARSIGAEMTGSTTVRKVSFTGSTAVGRLLMQQCAPTIKKITLELGGNAPFIVFADADLDKAIAGTIASKFRNTGQTCVCANRIFVQDTIYAEFTKKLVHAVRQLKMGNGLESGIQLGPLINEKALEKVERHVNDAIAKGGNVITGGKPHALGGLFFEPTVITEANADMLLAKEETFGPVAALFRFHTEEEVLLRANDTEYGLASYFYTQDIDRIWRVAEYLECGIVGINTGIISTEVAPFGGVKQSGIGREGSKYGIDPYVEIKYLCMGKGEV